MLTLINNTAEDDLNNKQHYIFKKLLMFIIYPFKIL